MNDDRLPLDLFAAKTPADVLRKLGQMKKLKPGWCGGYEIPPTESTVAAARQMAEYFFEKKLNVDVFPGDDNDVLVSCYKDDYALTVDVAENGYRSLSVEKGEGYDVTEERYQEFPSLRDIEIAVLDLSGGERCSLEFSTSQNTIFKSTDSEVTLLKIFKTRYQSLRVNAPWRRPVPSVNIFDSITPPSISNRPQCIWS